MDRTEVVNKTIRYISLQKQQFALRNIRHKLENIGYKFNELSCLGFVPKVKIHNHEPCTYEWKYTHRKDRISIHSSSFVPEDDFYIEEVFYDEELLTFSIRTTIIISKEITKVIKNDTWEKAEKRGWSPKFDFFCM